MDIEGELSVDREAQKAQGDPFEQLQMPPKPDETARPATSSNSSMGNAVAELAAHVAGGAVDVWTYGPLFDGAVELGGLALEGIGEIIAAIGEGL